MISPSLSPSTTFCFNFSNNFQVFVHLFSFIYFFTLWSAEMAKSTKWQCFFLVNHYCSRASGFVCTAKVSHFLWRILICAYTIWYYGQIYFTIHNGSPSRVKSCTPLCYVTSFANYVNNRFIYSSIYSKLAILLLIINFRFNINGP